MPLMRHAEKWSEAVVGNRVGHVCVSEVAQARRLALLFSFLLADTAAWWDREQPTEPMRRSVS